MYTLLQIGDFGMARDLSIDVAESCGGKIPLKWTAPEVLTFYCVVIELTHLCSCRRLCNAENTLQPVMCGAMGWCCTRYGH